MRAVLQFKLALWAPRVALVGCSQAVVPLNSAFAGLPVLAGQVHTLHGYAMGRDAGPELRLHGPSLPAAGRGLPAGSAVSSGAPAAGSTTSVPAPSGSPGQAAGVGTFCPAWRVHPPHLSLMGCACCGRGARARCDRLPACPRDPAWGLAAMSAPRPDAAPMPGWGVCDWTGYCRGALPGAGLGGAELDGEVAAGRFVPTGPPGSPALPWEGACLESGCLLGKGQASSLLTRFGF